MNGSSILDETMVKQWYTRIKDNGKNNGILDIADGNWTSNVLTLDIAINGIMIHLFLFLTCISYHGDIYHTHGGLYHET